MYLAQSASQTSRQTEVRRGGICPPPPFCAPAAIRLRCQGWERRAQAKSAGRALGRREHLRRGFASSAPGMKDIRNPGCLIAGLEPISTAVGALAPLPQPASQGPS